VAPSSIAHASIGFALWLPDRTLTLRDRPEYSIRMANDGVWNSSRGDNLLADGIPVE
jgi:hypothetical protein